MTTIFRGVEYDHKAKLIQMRALYTIDTEHLILFSPATVNVLFKTAYPPLPV